MVKYGDEIVRFEWDPVKELANIKKHKLSFIEAIHAFRDPYGLDLRDDKHSCVEMRRHWVGKIKDGRIITVRYTDRRGSIRIIGAAEWRLYRKVYYCEKAKTERP